MAGISSNATISNCYNTGYCKSDSAAGAEAIGGTNTNCYYLDTCGVTSKGAGAKTAEQFANGEVCFLLNGSTSKGRLSWYQTLGTDATPVFEGDIIYASYAHGATEGTYSNTKKEGVHTTPDEDGSHDTYYEMVTNEYGVSLYICSVCGHVKNPFADVFEKDWYYPYVCFAYQNMLMSGKGTDENGLIIFDPTNNMTRAEFVQALYSKEGKPEIVYQERFDDVPAGKWFTNAIMWAAENEIVSGKGDIFDVSGKITREEMAAILYKYAAFKGYETTGRKEATAYKDADSISKWAVNSIEWALYYGVMSGKGELLDPKGNATRAECATMLKSFVTVYTK